MNRKSVIAIASLLTSSILSPLTFAEDVKAEEKTSPYSASAELGLLFKTGNTKSSDIKVGFSGKYEEGKWLSLLNFDLLIKKVEQADANGNDEFATTDQKWTIVSQTNYKLNDDKHYVYGNAFYEENRFSGFDNQSSVSLGWGRHWYKSEKASLFADIGPGYKRDVTTATETKLSETNSNLIVQAQALYLRELNSHVDFKQLLVAKYAVSSDENSTYRSETSVVADLIDSLQLKFSLRIDYNTVVEEDKEELDTQTSLTLLYTF